MNQLLNSPFANTLVKYAFSKWGIVARRLGMIFVGWLAQKNIIPTADLENIQFTTTAFVTMLGTIAYGAFDLWCTSRQKAGVKAMQAAINKSDLSPIRVKVDGVAGNESVQAAAIIADVPVSHAIADAKSA